MGTAERPDPKVHMPTTFRPVHRGGCLCGAVAYEVTGAPAVLIVCHCTFCQRATGSSCLLEPVWREQDFKITAATPRRYEARSRGSGKRLTLHFCETCGTKLFQTMERFEGVVGVYGGTLDDPSVAAQAPQTWRIFLDDAQKGTVVPPGVDLWRQHRLDNDGTVAEPFSHGDFHVV
jgi:hypothetical protein